MKIKGNQISLRIGYQGRPSVSLFSFSLLVGSICWHPYCLLEHKNVELCFDHVSECSINICSHLFMFRTTLLKQPY